MNLLKERFILLCFTSLLVTSCVSAASIVSISEHQDVLVNASVRLECTVRKDYDESVIWLLKGNESDHKNSKVVAIESTLGDSYSDSFYYEALIEPKEDDETVYVFRIKKAVKEDAGTYICQIISFDSQVISRETTFDVHEPVTIELETNSTSIEINHGENVTIACSGTGEPAPNVTWYGKLITGWKNDTFEGKVISQFCNSYQSW